MATSKNDATVNALALIRKTARGSFQGERSLYDAIKACGQDDDTIKFNVYVGRVGATLGVTDEAAINLLRNYKVHNKDQSKNTDTHRTKAQEDAYGAARVWFTTFKSRWGLSTPKASPTKDDDTMDTSKLKAAPKQKVSDASQLAAYCVADASRDYDFFLLNKGHVALQGDMASELMGAYADMLATVKDIVARHTPKA